VPTCELSDLKLLDFLGKREQDFFPFAVIRNFRAINEEVDIAFARLRKGPSPPLRPIARIEL